MSRLIVFGLGSAVIGYLSRWSLRDRRRHGFFRFFAFESILALFLLNVRAWFAKPFSPRQLASWSLLTMSGGLAIHGFYLLRVVGRPRGNFESTTKLVEVGAYRYIRHPLYASLLALAWGAFLKQVSPVRWAVVGAASTFLYWTAKVEEDEMREKFGGAYEEYMRRTRMFMPGLF